VAYFGDATEPLFEEGSYTVSNVREGKPRSPEYHMYYNSSLIEDAAEAGDLLVMMRNTDSLTLSAVIAKAGTAAEAQWLSSIRAGERPVVDRFAQMSAPPPSAEQGHRMYDVLTSLPVRPDANNHPVFEAALATGRLPESRAMAAAGREIALAGEPDATPDTFMDTALNAETALYNRITDALGRAQLDALIERSAPLADFHALFMRIGQAAKSRRGLSLQHHFAYLLREQEIGFTPQCETEPGETADFIFPSCNDYHDADFPSEGLRMVACKSTARDRRRQVFAEAARIGDKYLLTLDPDLTQRVIEAMQRAHVRMFLPAPIITRRYPGHPALGSIQDLLGLLRKITTT
jgi:hypothetical protein